MKTPTLSRAVAVAGIAVFLAGCTSAGAPSEAALPSALAPGGLAFGGRDPANSVGEVFPEQFSLARRRSFHPHLLWATPDLAGTPRLLFISDFDSGNVNIYSMPDLTIKAQLAGWSALQGECPDRSGNVYIVDAEARYITAISRAGEEHGILTDDDGTPLSCAVNPINGDVAVTNNVTSGNGNIVIFPGGSGSGAPISVPRMHTYFFDGYDRSGNLWVDGYAANSKSIVASCSGSHCREIPVSNGTIFHPGFVQYAAAQKTWYVADRECGGATRFCIYPVSASGVLGNEITLTDAHGAPVCDMFQGTITDAGSRVFVGGVDDGLYANCGGNSVARWSFPAGGDPTNGNDDVGLSPTGAAISMKVGGF